MPEIDVPSYCTVTWPDPKNILELQVEINPPEGLWKGGKYIFKVAVPKGYPHNAPVATLLTPIYHPNIDLQGKVCLNILRADWKPILDLNAVILGLNFLFIEPNPNDPLNHEAAELQRDDFSGF